MSQSTLISEIELRAAMALSPLDRDAFDEVVRQRLLAAPTPAELNKRIGWGPPTSAQRVAASVLPVHLLGGAAKLPSLAQVGALPKLIGWIALPMACLWMVLITLFGMMKIRHAQSKGTGTQLDLLRWQAAYGAWWYRHRWIAGSIFRLALLSPFLGWTTPLLLLMVASGFAMVSLLTRLAQTDSVDQLALRASVRPTMFDRWLTDQAVIRFITRSRLDTWPALHALTWRDHFERDRALWFAMLWFAMLLVAMCVYAMLVTPREVARSETPRLA